jgi:hypothetical protein
MLTAVSERKYTENIIYQYDISKGENRLPLFHLLEITIDSRGYASKLRQIVEPVYQSYGSNLGPGGLRVSFCVLVQSYQTTDT